MVHKVHNGSNGNVPEGVVNETQRVVVLVVACLLAVVLFFLFAVAGHGTTYAQDALPLVLVGVGVAVFLSGKKTKPGA